MAIPKRHRVFRSQEEGGMLPYGSVICGTYYKGTGSRRSVEIRRLKCFAIYFLFVRVLSYFYNIEHGTMELYRSLHNAKSGGVAVSGWVLTPERSINGGEWKLLAPLFFTLHEMVIWIL